MSLASYARIMVVEDFQPCKAEYGTDPVFSLAKSTSSHSHAATKRGSDGLHQVILEGTTDSSHVSDVAQSERPTIEVDLSQVSRICLDLLRSPLVGDIHKAVVRLVCKTDSSAVRDRATGDFHTFHIAALVWHQRLQCAEEHSVFLGLLNLLPEVGLRFF